MASIVDPPPDGKTSPRLWIPGPSDRITADADGIDEIVLSNVSVHVERMTDRDYYVGFYDSFSGPSDALLIQSRIGVAKGRKKQAFAFIYTLDAPDALPVDEAIWDAF